MGTSFIAPALDGFGNAISYAANAVSFNAPVITGLTALHIPGYSLAQSLTNLAPITSPPNATIIGSGPSVNVTPPYIETNGLNALRLGVADSANMTVIQAVYIPTLPTAAANYVALWSTAATTTAGFTLLMTTNPQINLYSYNSTGTQTATALQVAVGQWNLIVTTIDNTNPAAPVVTLYNQTSGTSAQHAYANPITPSGSPIQVGLVPASGALNLGPLELALMVVHNTVLSAGDLSTSVNAFRNTMSARGITL